METPVDFRWREDPPGKMPAVVHRVSAAPSSPWRLTPPASGRMAMRPPTSLPCQPRPSGSGSTCLTLSGFSQSAAGLAAMPGKVSGARCTGGCRLARWRCPHARKLRRCGTAPRLPHARGHARSQARAEDRRHAGSPKSARRRSRAALPASLKGNGPRPSERCPRRLEAPPPPRESHRVRCVASKER